MIELRQVGGLRGLDKNFRGTGSRRLPESGDFDFPVGTHWNKRELKRHGLKLTLGAGVPGGSFRVADNTLGMSRRSEAEFSD